MKVKDVLKYVKANRYTFYNLDKGSINYFKKRYAYLRRNKDTEIPVFVEKQIKNILLENESDFLNKMHAMSRIERMMIL